MTEINHKHKVVITDLRASIKKDGKRYFIGTAVANGVDSYKSVFTEKARASIIKQIKANGVGSNFLHANDVIGNVDHYLELRSAQATTLEEKNEVEMLRKQLPLAKPPIGRVVDARFKDDKTLEIEVEENSNLKNLSNDDRKFIDTAWDAVSNKTVKGLSMAFNTVKSFVNNGKTFIDDIIITSVDVVDKAAHPDTQIVKTFMRAAEAETYDSSVIDENNVKMTENENEKNNTQPQKDVYNVDEIVERAEQRLSEKQKLEAERVEAENLKTRAEQFEKELAEIKEAKEKLETENKEAFEIAQEAIKQRDSAITKVDNPFAEKAIKDTEGQPDPFEGKSLKESFKMAFQSKKLV